MIYINGKPAIIKENKEFKTWFENNQKYINESKLEIIDVKK